jgi:hypothetical protein
MLNLDDLFKYKSLLFPLDYCLELAVFFNMVMVNMLDELCRRGLGPQGKSWKWDHLIQQDWT